MDFPIVTSMEWKPKWLPDTAGLCRLDPHPWCNQRQCWGEEALRWPLIGLPAKLGRCGMSRR